jgi:hypothetical protein
MDLRNVSGQVLDRYVLAKRGGLNESEFVDSYKKYPEGSAGI